MQPPSIDTGYLKHPVDAKILAEGIKWMDKVASRPVLATSLGERILPPQGKSIESEEERMDYVRGHISTQYHLIGTYVIPHFHVDDELRKLFCTSEIQTC
jgi:choline dehydrogenase-like flavoprotein